MTKKSGNWLGDWQTRARAVKFNQSAKQMREETKAICSKMKRFLKQWRIGILRKVRQVHDHQSSGCSVKKNGSCSCKPRWCPTTDQQSLFIAWSQSYLWEKQRGLRSEPFMKSKLPLWETKGPQVLTSQVRIWLTVLTETPWLPVCLGKLWMDSG